MKVESLKALGNKLLTAVSVMLSRTLRGYALNSPQSVFLELASTCFPGLISVDA